MRAFDVFRRIQNYLIFATAFAEPLRLRATTDNIRRIPHTGHHSSFRRYISLQREVPLVVRGFTYRTHTLAFYAGELSRCQA